MKMQQTILPQPSQDPVSFSPMPALPCCGIPSFRRRLRCPHWLLSAPRQCTRTLISSRSQILEILAAIQQVAKCPVQIKATVFEDNMGVFYLATNQRITARTRYFLVKYQHFWQAVRDGDIKIVKVDTKLQYADYLKKGLPTETFSVSNVGTVGTP